MSFDLIISMEVLEHVPHYKDGLKELHRCLSKDGVLLLTVPFDTKLDQTQIRAQIRNNYIIHLLQPEYHGNPVNGKGGSLCFQSFGWSFFDDLENAGFVNIQGVLLWSLKYGILGDVLLIIANK